MSSPVPSASAVSRRGRVASTGSPLLGGRGPPSVVAPRSAARAARTGLRVSPPLSACDHVAWMLVLVLLPPSETKAAGGDGAPLDLAALTAPELTPLRTELAEALVKLADDVPAARAALGLSPAQDDEIARNAVLWSAPTLPALRRYTGVLYDALDAGSQIGRAHV